MKANLQKFFDQLWNATLLRIVPYWFKPNFFTYLRFALTPVVLYFLWRQDFLTAFIIFILAALCDSIDGSLARVRNQITFSGSSLDPIADRLLVALSALALAYFYPYAFLLLIVIALDLVALLVAFLVLAFKPKKELVTANFWGKAKMVMEVAGVVLVFLYFIFNTVWLFDLSASVLTVAIILQVNAGVFYGVRVLRR